MKLYVLFESAAGYALFEREEIESLAITLPRIQDAINSMEHFSKLIKLTAFKPFVNSEKALENIKALAETHVTEDLIQFLDTNMPKTFKSKKGITTKVQLGLIDNKLGPEYSYLLI
jgi:hypothetical protein